MNEFQGPKNSTAAEMTRVKREWEIVETVAKYFDLRPKILEHGERRYFAMVYQDGSCAARLDVKVLQVTKERYDNVMVRYDRYERLEKEHSEDHIPTLLAVAWSDELGVYKLTNFSLYEVEFGTAATSRRGGMSDPQRIVRIPTHAFEPLSKMDTLFGR